MNSPIDAMGRYELLLARALYLLCRPNAVEAPVPGKAAFQDYLQEHIAEKTDIEAMASHFRLSKRTLYRSYRRLCGTTVGAMHTRMKIEWAGILLRMRGLNVSEVAQRVGYADQFYFSRVFKKQMGISPKAWSGKSGHY